MKTTQVIFSIAIDGFSYQFRNRFCGSESCKLCYKDGLRRDIAPPHGPYLDIKFKRGGKVVHIYIGLRLLRLYVKGHRAPYYVLLRLLTL
ncbi:hypothetical protein [Candidatus Uabimicrobium sp. HlEnr_7]|uniref:hypothetical protein n=1 Tax=Candidatus Uabimicrobium helgolandensis TaxID=3095367 RepID=UPI003555D388